MATTKEILDQWFAANPNATAAQVAAAVQSAGGLTPEVASVLANKYGTTSAAVTQEFIKQLAPQQLERAPSTTAMNYFGMDPESGSGSMETVLGAVQDSKVTDVSGTGELYRSSEPITIDGKQAYGLYDKNGKLFRLEADPSTGVRSDGGTTYTYWDPDGTQRTAFKADSGGGLFGSGIGPDASWVDFRDNLEAAGVVAGNYFLPGSSLLTSQLVTKGAQENLNTDVGKLANLAAGAAGGINGNLSNYGKIGEAVGLTNPAQVTEAEFLAYDTAAQQAAMGNDFAAIQQNLIASGIDPLDAASIVQTLGTNPGITGAQLAELSGKTVASETLGSQVGSNATKTAAGTVGSGIASAVGGSTGGSILGNIGAATSIAAGINSLTGGGLTSALGIGDKAPTAAEAQKMADPFSPYRSKLAEMYSGYLTGGNNTDLTKMPGYSQFESGVLNPALEATKRAGAKSGMLMSGNEQIALQKQGQTGYYGFMTDYLNRLATASGASVAPAQAANLGLAQGAANAQGVMQGTGAVATGLANLFGTNNTNVASTSSNTVGAGPAGYNWNLGSVDTSSWMD